jgi:hypothetical protein
LADENPPDKPTNLTDFRMRRMVRRREDFETGNNLTPFRREIPPRINPDTDNMIEQINRGYEKVKNHLSWLEDEFGRLVNTGALDPEAGCDLAQDCQRLYELLYDNTRGVTWNRHDPHLIADRAKYCEAVLMYELSQMQYRIGELATLGCLDRKENRRLQWDFFNSDGIVYDLWAGIVEATVDWSIDGGDFSACFYRDGRMVTTKIDLGLPRDAYDLIWPHHNDDLCGDGPIWKHPRGTLCHIEAPEPQDGPFPSRGIRVEVGYLLRRYAAAKTVATNLMPTRRNWAYDHDVEAAQDAHMLELSNEMANEADEPS